MVVSIITNGPVTGSTANGTSTSGHLSCCQQGNLTWKNLSCFQLQGKPILSVQTTAQEKNLQSTNFTVKDPDVVEIRETVLETEALTEDQLCCPEGNESDGELVIDDDNSCAVLSADKEEILSKHNDQSVENKTPRSATRNESHQKMDDAKNWLLSVMVISSSLSVVPLRSIEDAYKAHCQETGQEPLSTPVLARLIHGLFQDAEKCRLGPRGNQKIHYRNLAFIKDSKSTEITENHGNQNDKIRDELVKDQIIKDKDEAFDEEPLNLSQKHITNESNETNVKQEKNSLTNLSIPKDLQEQIVTTSEKALQNSDHKQIFDEDNKEGCEAAARKLSQFMKWINNQGRKDVLLKDFAHSASCKKESCSHLCMMFRRVRRHVVGARHPCMVLKLYSVLLRMHVSSCNNSECGLPACPALRATRPVKRTIESEEHSPKRAARQIRGGQIISSRAVFEPRSPGGSLPGSPVNSPIPSPDIKEFDQGFPLNSGSVQYMIVPVLPVVVSSGKRVA